jgi:hypothetical protein
MRGRAEFNFPAFDAAAARLRAMGWHVFSPAERDRAAGFCEVGCTGLEPLESLDFDHRAAMADDLRFICLEADAVYMLDGWRWSSGASAERAVAVSLGLSVFYEHQHRP